MKFSEKLKRKIQDVPENCPTSLHLPCKYLLLIQRIHVYCQHSMRLNQRIRTHIKCTGYHSQPTITGNTQASNILSAGDSWHEKGHAQHRPFFCMCTRVSHGSIYIYKWLSVFNFIEINRQLLQFFLECFIGKHPTKCFIGTLRNCQ
jgi:hypothetical protein